MPPLDPTTISTEAELRTLVLKVLRQWIPRLDRNRIRIHIPHPRGLLRLVPEMHFHLRPELFLQISGETLFCFPEEQFRVRPGEICLIPKGLPHREQVRPWGGPFSNLVFRCNPAEVFFHLAFEKPRGHPSGRVGSHISQNITSGLSMLLEEACELAQSSSKVRPIGIKGLILAHLSLLQSGLEGWHTSSSPEPFKVAQARQLVMQLLPRPELSVGYLARQLQCRGDYLSQLFRETTGIPLGAYISEHRLQRAQDLLQFSSLNVAEVSLAAGFRDPSYFTRAFHRWAGIAPGRLRKNIRGIGETY